MRKFVTSLVVAVALACPVSAQQIKIDPHHRIANVGNGYCGHCCIETVGRYLGYPQVHDLVRQQLSRTGARGGLMRDADMVATLNRYNIRHFYGPPGVLRYDRLVWACGQGYPCIVQFRPTPATGLGHYVIVVGVSEEAVIVVDPNDTSRVWTYQRASFGGYWNGSTIIVYPR